MKNITQPALAGVLALLLLQGAEARVAVVPMAVASGAFVVLFAIRHGVPSAQISTTLIVSTVASALTLAAWIVLSTAIWG
jgi:malonate transporter and related proteins